MAIVEESEFAYYSVSYGNTMSFVVKVERAYLGDFLKHLTRISRCQVKVKEILKPEIVEFDALSMSLLKDGKNYHPPYKTRRF